MLLPFLLFAICTHSVSCQESEETLTLKNGSQFFDWWTEPPVKPVIKIYIYNVTNADEFYDDGAKPILQELGPYVYVETWKKKNIKFHDNGTVSFNPRKIYEFDDSLSNGSEDDYVVVPNVPMLSTTSQAKYAPRFLREALSQIMDILELKPFVQVTVKQLLWGYEDPLLKLAKEVIPKETKLPYIEYGLMINKNGTSTDTITSFTGVNDTTKSGLIDRLNGFSRLTPYTSNECNSLMASDGFIFPPHLTKNSTIHMYEKDWCRILPLVFEKELDESGDIPTYRFTPPLELECCTTQDSPCAPTGFFNTTLCQYDSPILLSFPHFYLANDSYRTAFDGISPPDPEKHKFYVDVQPTLGTAVNVKTRFQINIAVSHIEDIKQVATFPDIIFPIMWFEEGFDSLPSEMTDLIKLTLSRPEPDENVAGEEPTTHVALDVL